MSGIDWGIPGKRFFEAGIDRGVLYVGDTPGVPWVGLAGVNQSQSGGQTKPHYLDGIKIGNFSSMEEFEATIQAFTYPTEFEQCDGTALLQNGLRVTQQRRKPFGMCYRTKIGNDVKGLDLAYKIHILYNLRAEPSDHSFATLSDQNTPMIFSWHVTSRPTLVNGLFPSAHYILDSRDIPAELLQTIEEVLYGNSEQDPSLPSPGELVFLFDSYDDLVYDAGDPFTPVFATYDAGSPSTSIILTIDGGTL